jgi:D-alanine--poly(phosphoribitol) ligase subunit 1
VVDAVTTHAADRPGRLAFRNGSEALTYGELAARADALAAALADRLAPGEPVAVLGHKQPEMVVAFLACMKTGRAYVPIDDGTPAARVAKILASSRVPLVLAPGAAELAAGHPAVLDRSEIVRTIERERGRGVPASAQLGPDDVVYVIYTSGSTGEPKGVQIELSSLLDCVDWAVAVHPIGGEKRFLDQCLFSFDNSALNLYGALITGGSAHALDRACTGSPKRLRPALADTDVEVWFTTASFAEMCLLDPQFTATLLPNLRCFMFAGETLPVACARRLHERFPLARVFDLYGPTETTIVMTSLPVDEPVLSTCPKIPLGAAMPGTRILLLDSDGATVPDGTEGEIVIEGACVARGYLGNPELTARSFSGAKPTRRYRSGDAACVVDGRMYFRGRIDLQVKLDGNRIELDDIATNLGRLPRVAMASVVPVMREGKCRAIVAFVVLEADATVTPGELRDGLAALVPSYMIPREFRICASLPLTANGKLDRARLIAELSTPEAT